MNVRHFPQSPSRRAFLASLGSVGTAALAHLLSREAGAADALPLVNPLAPKPPHYPGKAKNVIFLFQAGGPSQIDLYDPKPMLQKWHGKSLPSSMTKDLPFVFIKPDAKVLG